MNRTILAAGAMVTLLAFSTQAWAPPLGDTWGANGEGGGCTSNCSDSPGGGSQSGGGKKSVWDKVVDWLDSALNGPKSQQVGQLVPGTVQQQLGKKAIKEALASGLLSKNNKGQLVVAKPNQFYKTLDGALQDDPNSGGKSNPDPGGEYNPSGFPDCSGDNC